MKAIFPGFAPVDASSKTLDESALGGDVKDSHEQGQDFDALLAQLAQPAQSAASVNANLAPVKPLAPSVPKQAQPALSLPSSSLLLGSEGDAASLLGTASLFSIHSAAFGRELETQPAADGVAQPAVSTLAPLLVTSPASELAAQLLVVPSALDASTPLADVPAAGTPAQPQTVADAANTPPAAAQAEHAAQSALQQAPVAAVSLPLVSGAEAAQTREPAAVKEVAEIEAQLESLLTQTAPTQTNAGDVQQGPQRSAVEPSVGQPSASHVALPSQTASQLAQPASSVTGAVSLPTAAQPDAAQSTLVQPVAGQPQLTQSSVVQVSVLHSAAPESGAQPALVQPVVVREESATLVAAPSAPAEPAGQVADLPAAALAEGVEQPELEQLANALLKPAATHVAASKTRGPAPKADAKRDALLQELAPSPPHVLAMQSLIAPAPAMSPVQVAPVVETKSAPSVATAAATPAAPSLVLDDSALEPASDASPGFGEALDASAEPAFELPAQAQPAATVALPVASALSAAPLAPSASPAPVAAAPASAPALDVVAPAVASQTLLAMQDAETGAKVTSVEFYQSASVSAPSAAPVSAPSTVISAPTTQAAVASAVSVLGQQAKAPLAAGSASAPSEAPADAPVSALELATPVEGQTSGSEQTEISEAAHEGAPRDEAQQQQDHGAEAQTSDGQSSGAGQQAETAPRQVAFQPSEVQGMRGLDAIVASLLRTGAGDDKSAAGAGRTNARLSTLEVGKVQTAKSETTKDAEKSQLESQALKESALLREEERSSVREALQLEPQHAFMAELRHEPLAMLDAAPEVLPLPAPVLVQDPDAAAMGKIARGEGVNAAAISIDHPEFGAMDVVVHNENGRIDVRATLETPKAAAVMRAHESALRYGIQQAGMTFGALRVRSRGQEPTQLKQRDSVKRRRSEWEA